MEKKFYSGIFPLLVLFVVAFSSCAVNGVTPVVEVGNWQWKSADAATNLTTSANTPITINTVYDVVTLRCQALLELTNTNTTNNGKVDFNVYLQYYDAGPSTAGSTGWISSPTYGVMPLDQQRHAGINQYTGSYDRFSGSGAAVSGNASLSQTDGWHTIADEGTSYIPSSNDYSATRSAFTLSSFKANSTNGNILSGTYGSNPGYTQLSITPQYVYGPAVGTTTPNCQVIYTSTNGKTTDDGNFPLSISVTNAPNTRTTASSYRLYEFEFHIKSAAVLPITSGTQPDKSTNIGVSAGHRYFFRIRVASKITTTGTPTTAYNSPYGIGGVSGNNSTADALNVTTEPGKTIGNYLNNNPFPYLDINPNILAITLPVTYTTPLRGTWTNNSVQLSWTTGSEVNNSYFLVQRSPNGNSDWTPLGKVKSHYTDGNGSGYSYEYWDRTPLSGDGYYRLVQYDLDGHTATGSVARITNSQAISYSLYPNPATSVVNISGVSTGDKVYLLNTGGQISQSLTVSTNPQQINVNNLTSGIYFVKIVGKQGTTSLKFLKK